MYCASSNPKPNSNLPNFQCLKFYIRKPLPKPWPTEMEVDFRSYSRAAKHLSSDFGFSYYVSSFLADGSGLRFASPVESFLESQARQQGFKRECAARVQCSTPNHNSIRCEQLPTRSLPIRSLQFRVPIRSKLFLLSGFALYLNNA